MTSIINNLAIFFVSMLFYEQAVAQSNNPIEVFRCSYDSDKLKQREYEILPIRFFPWGVCVHHRDHLNRSERDWTREAMKVWNTGYKNYVYNEWRTYDVVNIPEGPLFVESCDRGEHNIIYIHKADLSDKQALADYDSFDYWLDFLTFYAEIRIHVYQTWTKAWFINVMIHELGHALGLPHAPKGKSNFMSRGKTDCDDTDAVCEFTDYDFETFLAPYPGFPETRENYEARRKAEIEAERQFNMEWHCSRGPGGFGRGTAGCIRI